MAKDDFGGKNKVLISNTSLIAIGNIFSKAIAFISAFFFSRLLSVEDYGELDLLLTYGTLLVPILSLAIYEGVYRNIADEKDESNICKYITNGAAVVLGSNILLIILAILIYGFNIFSGKVLFMFILYIVSNSMFTFLQYVSRGLSKMYLYAVSGGIYSVCMILICTVLTKNMNLGIIGMLGGYSIAYMIAGAFLIKKLRLIKSFNLLIYSSDIIKKMIKYSFPLMFTGIAWWIMSASDRTIIHVFLGDYENGIYSVAHKIPTILAVLYSAFQYSWTDSAIHEHNDKSSEIWFNQVLNYVTIFLVDVSVIILSFNYYIYNFLFPNTYIMAQRQMPILLLASILMEIGTFFGGIYIAKRDSKYQSKTYLFAAVVNLVLCVLLINILGLYAASISTLIANLVLVLCRYCNTRKYVKWKLEKKIIKHTILLGVMLVLVYFGNGIVSKVVPILALAALVGLNYKFVIKILSFIKNK